MMIVRIVKLTLIPENLPVFKSHFELIKGEIRNFPGCLHLELLAEKGNPSVLFTYSHWGSEAHLEAYLKSPFFKDTWSKVKPLFGAPAAAWSLEKVSGAGA